jgi:predicted flap endonuclease-1-like 5' DNA nuclease
MHTTPSRFTSALLVILAMAAPTGCAQAPGTPVVGAPSTATSFEAERAYAIENMLGIGPVYGKKLREAGVTSTAKLVEATRTRYKRQSLAAKADVPYKLVLAWAQKVALMELPGIGPRQSNLLAAVGVESVQELARRDPANLHERLAVANTFKPRFVDATPSLATVQKWVEGARRLAARTDAE